MLVHMHYHYIGIEMVMVCILCFVFNVQLSDFVVYVKVGRVIGCINRDIWYASTPNFVWHLAFDKSLAGIEPTIF